MMRHADADGDDAADIIRHCRMIGRNRGGGIGTARIECDRRTGGGR